MIKATVTHLPSGRQLALAAIVATSFAARARGMIGRRFAGFDCMIFPRCGSIHSCFMGVAIDVVFIDAKQRVTAVHHDVLPWRAAGGRGGTTAIELPVGAAADVAPGDQLAVLTAAEAARPQLRPGDVVFTAVPNMLYRRVAKSSGTWTSHVGFVFDADDHHCRVAESAVPLSRLTSFERFVARSDFAQFAILRLPEPPGDQAMARLREVAEARLGTPYNLWFNYDSNWQFCSKFVYDCYRDALGIELGEINTFGDVLAAKPDMSLVFWRLWFLGKLPLNKRTVTPGAQFESPQLQLVHHDPGIDLP